MKHLLRGRTVTVAVVSGVAAALAAGAFGLPAASGDDPAPIELDIGSATPVTPVPLDPAAATTPTTVSPVEPAITEQAPTAEDAATSTSTAASPASVASPAPASVASPATASPPSADSAPSAGSIDS